MLTGLSLAMALTATAPVSPAAGASLQPGPRKSHSTYVLSPPYVVSGPVRAGGVAIGDVTGDCMPDLVVRYGQTLTVFAQQPNGGLGPPAPFDTGVLFYPGFVLSDLNADGVMDVVVSPVSSGIMSFIADGRGGLVPGATMAGPTTEASLHAMDVDRDGNQDILGHEHLGNELAIFFGDGAGGFSRTVLVPTTSRVYWSVLGDVNGDGLRDFVTLHRNPSPPPDAAVYLHDGIGSFVTPPATYSVPRLQYLGVGDIDGDGDQDLVLGPRGGIPDPLHLLKQNPAGGLDPPVQGADTRDLLAIQVADLDGDGADDVAVLNGDGTMGVILQDPATGLEPEDRYAGAPMGGANGFAVGDFSGDGCAEVALTATDLVLMYGDGCPASPPCHTPHAVATAPAVVCAGDGASLDASLSTNSPCGTSGGLQYQWSDPGGIVCPWSASPSCSPVPLGPTTYTLEVAPLGRTACGASTAAAVMPVYRPAIDAGVPITACAGEVVQLAGSSPGGCPPGGVAVFRWLDGLDEACPPSTSPRCQVVATTTRDYTLELYCTSEPGCVVSAAVTVTVEPEVTPPGLANTVRARKWGVDVVVTWESEPLARSYTLYRSDRKDAWAAPLQEDILGLTAVRADVSGGAPLFLYRVAAASCRGVEGP